MRRKPFAILRYLAKNPQRLVTQRELVEAVWGQIAMSEGLLRTHIHELRQNIGEGMVETVVGRGYRFVPKVAQMAESPSTRRGEAPPSPLVGRDDAMTVLREDWAAALE